MVLVFGGYLGICCLERRQEYSIRNLLLMRLKLRVWGAEIASEHFQSEFKDKHVMDGEAVALGVVKNGKVENPEFQVDGISGGTITSVGVDAMLKGCMTHYAKFLTSKE